MLQKQWTPGIRHAGRAIGQANRSPPLHTNTRLQNEMLTVHGDCVQPTKQYCTAFDPTRYQPEMLTPHSLHQQIPSPESRPGRQHRVVLIHGYRPIRPRNPRQQPPKPSIYPTAGVSCHSTAHLSKHCAPFKQQRGSTRFYQHVRVWQGGLTETERQGQSLHSMEHQLAAVHQKHHSQLPESQHRMPQAAATNRTPSKHRQPQLPAAAAAASTAPTLLLPCCSHRR